MSVFGAATKAYVSFSTIAGGRLDAQIEFHALVGFNAMPISSISVGSLTSKMQSLLLQPHAVVTYARSSFTARPHAQFVTAFVVSR